MTIEYRKGNILEVTEGIILHGCNTKNGFGSGIAGQIARKYPSVKEFYHHCYSEASTVLGNVDMMMVSDSLWIYNGYTQEDFGSDGKRYADFFAIISVMIISLREAEEDRLKLHVPAIGCGLGGLDWETEVKPLYESLGRIYDFVVYEPW